MRPLVLPNRSPTRRVKGSSPCLAADRKGVTAVELALLFPVVLTMMFMVLEVGLEFVTQVVLDHAVAVAARQVQMGNAATAPAFTTAVCNASSSMLISSCSSNLQVYVTSGTSFAALTLGSVSSGSLTPTTYSPGTAGSDVIIQAAYSRPYLFKLFSTMAGSTTKSLLSTVAVQNEPY